LAAVDTVAALRWVVLMGVDRKKRPCRSGGG
jgi:hypothetical protein